MYILYHFDISNFLTLTNWLTFSFIRKGEIIEKGEGSSSKGGGRCWHLRGSIIFEKKICDCLFLSLKRKQSPKFSTAIDYAS